MAITIEKTVSDNASGACFEISGTGDDSSTIDVSSLKGAGDADNQSVMVTKVIATVAQTNAANLAYVTLSWGGEGMFLVLPPGHTEISEAYMTDEFGGTDGDITVEAPANTFYSVKIYVKKVTGFHLSMAHAAHRG